MRRQRAFDWQERVPVASVSRGLAEDLEITPQFLKLLLRRGLATPENIESYLTSPISAITPPDRWPQIPEAAEYLAGLIQADKKIAVWGDYDTDGVTATALVLEVLGAHNAKLSHHLPMRLSEGYGLNVSGVESLHAQGCQALLTVDCGISNIEAVGRARELGMDVVITDHHMPQETLPPAQRIVNPRMDVGAKWPCAGLAGVGVVFYLMGQVNRLLAPGSPKFRMGQVLDLAALGTIADVMPLQGENRAIVRAGILRMGARPRPGIAALKQVAGLDQSGQLNSEQVAFALTPRLNAAGRMGDAQLALDLLTARDASRASELAEALNQLNIDRKRTGLQILNEAREQAKAQTALPHSEGLVLYSAGWHPGIVGIVANKIAEEYARPTIILCGDDEEVKGSGRSIGDFDLHLGLQNCAGRLLGFGGHKKAAGLRMRLDELERFRRAFSQAVVDQTGGHASKPPLLLDGILDFEHARDPRFLEEISLMQPFGEGNPEPVFVSPLLEIRGLYPLGHDGESVRVDFRDLSTNIILRAKAWRRAKEFNDCRIGEKVRIAYTPKLEIFRGLPNIDLQLADWEAPAP